MAATLFIGMSIGAPNNSALLALKSDPRRPPEASWRSPSFRRTHLTDRSWRSKHRMSQLVQRFTPTPNKLDYSSAIRLNRMIPRAAAANWAVSLCDHLEAMVFTSKLSSGTAPNEYMPDDYFLSGNFKPVPEMAPTTVLRVTGTIPECMDGEYMRVGPNPRYVPRGGYHWFDGDGMIHGLHMKNGKATYVARYVQTTRLQQEEHYGAPKFMKVGDLRGMKGYWCAALQVLRLILGVLDIGFKGSVLAGNANTALVYHNKKILALHEHDKPYIIKVLEDGDVQTVGHEDFKQKLEYPFAAHPKIDPITGEMFSIAFRQQKLLRDPQFNYHVVSKEGILREPVPITASYKMMHDFAITENYAIFIDVPFCFDFLGMAQGKFVLKFDSGKKSRLGVLPKHATNDSELRWFTIPTCCIIHTRKLQLLVINSELSAWEEGDEVLLTCVRNDGVNMESFSSEIPPKLYEYRLNLRTGDVKHRQLSSLPVEFPRINADYTGRKVRYAYCAINMGTDEKLGENFMKGVAKFDFALKPQSPTSETRAKLDLRTGGNVTGLFIHGPGRCGGDTIFVPRNPGGTLDAAAEDDGYLITYVYDKNTGKSEAVIIDAKTMGRDPVAVIELPGRVPYGFHAHFVSQAQLQQQAH